MKTIVVVEDQSVMATAYSNKFRGQGFNVEVALDGEAGLELVNRVKPDLILLDLHLPKMSGLEVLRKVRSIPAFQTLPIVVLSNLTRPGATEEAWEAGATLVLSKLNTSPNRVLEAVQSALAASIAPAPQNISAIETHTPSPLVARQTVRNDDEGRGHVLLVEDNPDLNSLLAFLLSQAGHHVTAAGRSADALQRIGAQSFDLCLMGRSDPANGGLSLCKQVRRSCPVMPIIIYATAALFSEQQEGLKAGATAYLVKPEDLFNVGQIASHLLRKQRVEPNIRVA
jgi:CheY-like chemotaxis protein